MASNWTYDAAASLATNNSGTLTISETVVPPVGSLLVITAHEHTTTSFSTGSIADNGGAGAGAWHAATGMSGTVAHFACETWYKIATAADFNGGAGITVTVTWAGGGGTILNRMRADVFTLPAGYVPTLDNAGTATGGSGVTGLSGPQTTAASTWADALALGVICCATTNGGTNSAKFTNFNESLAAMTQSSVTTGNTLLNLFYLPIIDTGGQFNNWQFAWITAVTNPATMGVVFNYTPPAPTVTGVSPNNGSPSGGTSVTITGTNFTDSTGAWTASGVTFGGVAATSVVVVNATTITCVSPAGTGTVDVKVTTPGGTSAASGADQFTYNSNLAVISSVNPNLGPSAGGTSVTIDGQFFTGATTVNFGANPATGVTVVNDFLITCTAPAGTNNTTVDIEIVTPAGTSTPQVNDEYTYLDIPVVTSINPTSGTASGGTPVVVTGSGFSTGVTAVEFGGVNAAFTVINDTTIDTTSPFYAPGPTLVDINVFNAAGGSTSGAGDEYQYTAFLPPPPAPTSTPGGGGDGEDRVQEQRAWWDTDEERDLEALIRLGAL